MIAYVYCKFYLICYFLFVFKNIKVEKKSIKSSVSLWFIYLTLLKLTNSVVWATLCTARSKGPLRPLWTFLILSCKPGNNQEGWGFIKWQKWSFLRGAYNSKNAFYWNWISFLQSTIRQTQSDHTLRSIHHTWRKKSIFISDTGSS